MDFGLLQPTAEGRHPVLDDPSALAGGFVEGG